MAACGAPEPFCPFNQPRYCDEEFWEQLDTDEERRSWTEKDLRQWDILQRSEACRCSLSW